MPLRSYLKNLTTSTSPSSSIYDVGDCDVDGGPNYDVDALRWKLYGKNEHFRIMHEAAVTIQSFWRGCFSRAMTSTMIQTLIEDITAFRKLEAEYKKRDEENQRNQQQPRMQDPDPGEENGSDDDKKHNSGLTGNSRLARRNKKNKPWQLSTEDDGSDDRMATLVPSTRKLSKVMEGEEEEEPWKTNRICGFPESVDDDTRGYRRYRSNIHVKNKTRPWRDDTNVFDAY